MSIPLKNSKPKQSAIPWIVLLVIALVCCRICSGARRSREAPRPSPTARTAPVREVLPAPSPIEEMLKPPANIGRKQGIAVAILMDTSGSMGDTVPDVSGKAVPKIEIARRAIKDLLARTEKFVTENPDRELLLGVYEFSAIQGRPAARKVVPVGPPNLAAALAAVDAMKPGGATPIGDAIIQAKRDLDATGESHLHILVVTDGENNRGYNPNDVVGVISRMDAERRASVYFVAFDVAAGRFNGIRDQGGLVLSAKDGAELQRTLDYVLTGKILAEQPVVPKQ